MKKKVLFFGAVFLGVFLHVLGQGLEWEDISGGNLNFRSVLVDDANPQLIYSGTNREVLKTEDGGKIWRSILRVKGQDTNVNFISFDNSNKNILYAATGNGLYVSNNQGRRWERIFKGKSSAEAECTAVVATGINIFLGTKAGLFYSQDKGRTWHKEIGKIGTNRILTIAQSFRDEKNIYVAGVDGVFRTKNNGNDWERVFVAHPVENGNEDDNPEDDHDEEKRYSGVRYICLDPNNHAYLYLSSDKGVYKSSDQGNTWYLLSDYGLINKEVSFIFMDENSNLYAAARSGIFEYKNERWKELSFGLSAGEVRFLAHDNKRNLYAACEKGLFKAGLDNFVNYKPGNPLVFYSEGEPRIGDVQKAAIKYAEVEPNKIIKWRKQAAKKAIMPQVSAGVGRNVTDLWHWEGGSTTKPEDDILRRGNDAIEWDVTLSWDLSELIWNNDQTSIDTRSRLMVQLRDDILDEVTKTYFERMRVKIELNNLAIEDKKRRIEKELRLQELTASLDALTGGYFTQNIKG
ncbi:MAG: hypothetical protein HY761_00860 [Candidatus Omnitrophica bacterium]|nr:hypothetical protein [Candidatus Omnitrophota bacterium]